MSLWIIICLLFSGFYAAQLLLYLKGWRGSAEVGSAELGSTPFVSILVPVRNEEQHLEACLQGILEQRYPKDRFEVIVIDDFSDDGTEQVLSRFSNEIKLVRLADHLEASAADSANKKNAISLGVKQAQGELIVTTDGDCLHQKDWLSSMVQSMEDGKLQFATAPVLFKPGSKMIERFQELDLIGLMGITAASIRYHFGLMCNGANLIYRKSAFQEVGGFSGVDKLPTGDDIFLMHKIAERYPEGIGFVKNKAAIVQTDSESDFAAFITQRLRWLSKSTHFTDRRGSWILVASYLFHLCMMLNLVCWLAGASTCGWLLLIGIATKLLFEFSLISQIAGFFNRSALMKFFIPLSLLHIFYVIFVGLLANFLPYTWKGRKVQASYRLANEQ